ncbi:pentapeptide repeat-containing protein [Alkanindiges illinoisensis]|uniref:Pentapeptide repeat-containing protein n=1 Tax=Alkanindiges illinoisensis TaxID=197183 RepID=A0A4Y7XDX4_9GAMM|nr:pentapeptide repeat-containing protein [Alkanindiges illinoisensis]TEU29360.1 pentapeptide repeat-containing protein [Alkanindiges illinoisensis]
MRNWLQDFWRNPVKRRWVIIINLIMLALSYGTFNLLDKQINPWVSLGLIILALFCEILVFAFYVPDQLKEICKDIKAFIAWSNRDAIYHHYHLKHEDKEYKGPDWEDEEFKKIIILKERVDAFIKASIAYQKVDFERWKKRNLGVNLDHQSQTAQRILKVAIATFISLVILFILYKWLKFDSDTISILIKDSRSPVLAALITTVITSPVIFIIWVFRDKNNRVQIENGRKDTNLKDFQKLSEWASGFHLPEIKQTTTTKTTNKTTKDIQENIEETTTSQEDFLVPEGSNSISRRLGAEALQASAIAQLEAFMFGKYGEQFMQPAFLLIHAIWESIITQQQARFYNEQEFKNSLPQFHKNPIIAALNRALIGANGNHLRLFLPQLIGLNLKGTGNMNFSFGELTLAGLTLDHIDLSFSYFSGTQLQGTKLRYADLSYANFNQSNFQKANFQNALLVQTKLNYSHLTYADLRNTNLTNTSFRSCNLQFADLEDSIMSNTNLTNSQLHNANLSGVAFEGTIFTGAKINRFTLFLDHEYEDQYWESDKVRETILLNGAIWDDDPEWLEGKIQNLELLKSLKKYGQKRNPDGTFTIN